MAYKRSAFPEGGYDVFKEKYDVSPDKEILVDEYYALWKMKDRTTLEEDRFNQLTIELEPYLYTAEHINHYQDAMSNVQKFFVENTQGHIDGLKVETRDYVDSKKQEMDTYVDGKKIEINQSQADMFNYTNLKKSEVEATVTNGQTSINTTKDSALISIEQKKENIIDYMDGTTAGRIRNDIGVMGDLTTVDKASLVNAVNEINAKEVDLTPIEDKIDILSGTGGTVEKANKSDLESHKADYASFKNNIEAIRYVGEKIELKINGEWIEFKSGSQYPVGNVSGLKVDEDDMQVTINWVDPPDLTIKDSLGNLIILSKWAGTQLRRKKLSYPSSENDGELVVDSKIREQYKVNGYVDSGLVNDEEYFYMLFPYTEDGVFTVDSANRISATPTEINPDTWSGIQKIVRQGLASEFFEVGDEIVTEYDDGEIIWQVIGIDVDTPADPELTHSMTLQTKDCLHDIQFDAPEPSNPDSNRRSYGNNRYLHSAVRQWLNSDESTFIWQSQHQYDAKPTGSLDLYDGAGFLNRLDPELVAVLGNVKKKVAKNIVTDGGGQEEFTDKVFLLSQLEVDLGTEGTTTGEFVYPFYQGKGNANRIKNLNHSPRGWWLRPPYVSNSSHVRRVTTSGSLTTTNAIYSSGLSPACTIC